MLKPRVETKDVDGLLVAEFWDCMRLDPEPVRALRRAVEDHLDRGGRPVLVVDMRGVSFAGSSALGGFSAIQRLCRAQGGRFVFCEVEATVMEVFRLTNLESLFQFAPDMATALTRIDNPPGPDAVAPPNPAPARSSAPAPLARRRKPS